MRFRHPAYSDLFNERMTMNRLLAALLALAFAVPSAHAIPQSDASELSGGASALMAVGSIVVVGGSMSVLAGASNVVVASVEAVGDGVVVVLKGASDASRTTLRFSTKAAREASLVAGSAVSVTVIASGYLLVAAGKVLAFIPNEAGKALIHHSRAGSGA